LVLQVALARLPARLSGEVQTRLRVELLDAYLAASWAEKAKEKDGHLQELMGNQAAAAGTAVLQLAGCVSAGMMFLALTVAAFLLSAGLAVTVMVTATLLFAALRPMSRRVRRHSAATSAASISQASGVAESVHMAEEISVFGVVEAERMRVSSLVESLEEHYVRTRTLSAIVPVLYQSAVIFLLIGGLALLVVSGTTRLAALGAVVLLLVRASSLGYQLQTAYQRLGESAPFIDRTTSAIEHYVENARTPGDTRVDSIRTIEFQGVYFAYTPNVPVIRDVSFTIRPGEAIGVVGPSGAGKSTLVQLLLRLREPTTGRYCVNGLPAGSVDDELWHQRVTYLPQEPHLLNGSVTENIRFYRSWVSDESIRRAAQLAHIDADITTWIDGYETIVGQRANAVSGGQRQRLCLARALAGAPEVLILDEPTSSLDPHSEHLIQRSLDELHGDLTLVLVAHRLTTLDLCDRVMVIRGGQLEAFAPADILSETNEFYRRAVKLASGVHLP
jgi:ABC-type multidrug transport system fused ATPase/permease subunit